MRDESRDSNHWLTLKHGNVVRVDFAFDRIHGEMAGDSRLGGRRDGSGDSDHWVTLSRGNVTSVDFTFELIHRELAGRGRSVESHIRS
jgi:hypothetical protein